MSVSLVYETWLEQKRTQRYAVERTAEITGLPETRVRRIIHVVSRWRARGVLRQAEANNGYWRKYGYEPKQ